jgi:multimeric flavodoxin WrbA
MTQILGIVGSPNKNGRTRQLVDSAVSGAASAGAETDVMYLGDEEIKPCRGCKLQKCWEDGICKLDDSAGPRNQRIKEADGVIFGAPVYFHDINGLAKDFIDKVRIPPRGGGLHTLFLPTNGKPAFAVTIAGGTGKGALTSLGAIHWGLFLPCGFRALKPVAATPFNFGQALLDAAESGKELVVAAEKITPFKEQGLADRIRHFQETDLVNSDFTDDNLFLAEKIFEAVKDRSGEEQKVNTIQSNIEQARQLISAGRKPEAAEYTSRAYEIGRALWDTRS